MTSTKGPQDADYRVSPMLCSTAEDSRLCVQERPALVCNTSFYEPRYNIQLCPSMDATASTSSTYTEDDPNLRRAFNMPVATDVPGTMMEETRGAHAISVPCGIGWRGTCLDEHAPLSSDPFYPDGQLLPRFLIEETPLHEPSGVSHLVHSFHGGAPRSHPPTPHHNPLHHLLGSHLTHRWTRPAFQSYSPIHRPLRHDSIVSTHRRRPTRAIEYNGRWIDEAELLQGLMQPSGNINVHHCRWEEDLSPCHLSIKGDRSSINLHIQKWHGGKPGGDKLRATCRWSGCGAAMLKDSIPRHVLSIHLGEVWKCRGCGKEIVRNDAYGRHAARSGFKGCRTLGAVITYTDAEVVNAQAVLNGGGKLRYNNV